MSEYTEDIDEELEASLGDIPTVSVEDLLRQEQEEFETVKLPSGKGSMVIRELTRAEVMSVKKDVDVVEREQIMLSMAVIDPQMTKRDVRRWQQTRGATPDIEEVARRVAKKSGLTRDTPKSTVRSDGDDS